MSDRSLVMTGQGAMVTGDRQGTERLFQLAAMLEDKRRPWEELYCRAFAMMAPEYADWSDSRRLVSSVPVYNSKPQTYVGIVQAGLQGYLTPQGGNWVEYELEDRRLLNAPGVRVYLQEAREHMDGALQSCGFYSTLDEGYPQLIVAGTHHVERIELEVEERLMFRSLHPSTVHMAVDRFGRPNTWAVTRKLPLVELDEAYPGKLPEDLRRRVNDYPFEEHAVTVLILPRSVRVEGKGGWQNKPWATYHLLKAPRVLLKEGGTSTPPIITGRWSKSSEEGYGRGWGLRVLSDVERLNEMTRTELIAAQWAIDPALGLPADMREEIDFVPGARVPMAIMREVKTLYSGGNYPIGKDAKNTLEEAIREAWMVNFFLSLLQGVGSRTATEVMELQGEKAAILGTMIDRTHNETVIPMLRELWDYETKAGRMPKAPRALTQSGASIKLKFVGPLAMIARRFHLHQGLSQTLGTFAPIVQMSQGEALDVVNWTELGRHVLENDGSFPKTVINDRRVVAQIRENRARQMAEAQEMQQLESLGKAAPGLEKAGMLKGGVPGMPGPMGAR